MKLLEMKRLLWIIPIFSVVGCTSHHPQKQPVVVYKTSNPAPVVTYAPEPVATVEPGTTVVVPAPPSTATSTSSEVRVYPAPTQSITTPVPPPVKTVTIPDAAVSSDPRDIVISDEIRRMLEADAPRRYRNVHFSVDKGIVTMRGMVPTDNDRMELQNQIVAMTGVTKVDNKLDVEPSQP